VEEKLSERERRESLQQKVRDPLSECQKTGKRGKGRSSQEKAGIIVGFGEGK